MREIKNVLIVGLGAIGAIYAIKAQELNPDCVKVLVDESRIDRYKKDGILFNDKKYDFDYVLDTDKGFEADLILIATKAGGFEQASGMIRNFVGENTLILSLLNGIFSEKVLIEKYGEDKVLYSYFLGHASMKKGNKITFDGIGDIFLGEAENKTISPRVQAVKDFFDKAKIDYKISEDMISALWQKFVINVGANQTLTALQAPYGAFKSKYVQEISCSLMGEAAEIAKKLGVKDAEYFVERGLKSSMGMGADTYPSMMQDVQNGNKTEVDIFAGEVCRLGKKYNISTPKNEMVFNIISFIDEQNS